jgi:NAD(P)H-dependent FMN reductase
MPQLSNRLSLQYVNLPSAGVNSYLSVIAKAIRAGERQVRRAEREVIRLAIIWHSRTGAAEAMAAAAKEGAGAAGQLIAAGDATPDDLLAAGAYLFVCPENLGAVSGMMKEMFDRCYYPLLGRVEGRAYATAIAAGSDGAGAQAQIDRIVTGWRLKRVAEPLIVNFGAQTPEAILAQKTVGESALTASRDLGAALSSGLELGIF